MRTRKGTEERDVIVVGGGLAGLAAATYLARGGARVRVYERANALGGRARTTAAGEYRFNQGPHALYRAGRALEVLRELDVPVRGGVPGAKSFALDQGELRALPSGAMGLLTSRLLSWGGRLEIASLFARLDGEAAAHASTTLQAWLEQRIKRDDVRRLVAALVRVSSYANDPAHQSAGAALAQLALAARGNVMYVDGGWETLVFELRAAAQGAGAVVTTNAHVDAVIHEGAVRGVRVDGRIEHADAVIVATGPSAARALIGDASAALRAFDEDARPVNAACLDVALSRLPNPEILFTTGFDAPLYFSVHSKTAARLAPEAGALVHVARYLAPNESGDVGELEALLDRVQPGWRDVVVERRFMPKMCVMHALVTAKMAGLRGRMHSTINEIEGLFVAGDWVGAEGMLADAALASAREAARSVLAAKTSRRRYPASAHGFVSRDLS